MNAMTIGLRLCADERVKFMAVGEKGTIPP